MKVLLLTNSFKYGNPYIYYMIVTKRGGFVFKKLKPQRPVVIRNRDTVKVCYYYKGTKNCLGPLCYWVKVGRCPIFNRIKARRGIFTAK
jgi:hypothetical protein